MDPKHQKCPSCNATIGEVTDLKGRLKKTIIGSLVMCKGCFAIAEHTTKDILEKYTIEKMQQTEIKYPGFMVNVERLQSFLIAKKAEMVANDNRGN